MALVSAQIICDDFIIILLSLLLEAIICKSVRNIVHFRRTAPSIQIEFHFHCFSRDSFFGLWLWGKILPAHLAASICNRSCILFQFTCCDIRLPRSTWV